MLSLMLRDRLVTRSLRWPDTEVYSSAAWTITSITAVRGRNGSSATDPQNRVQRFWHLLRKRRFQTLWWMQDWILRHIYKSSFTFFRAVSCAFGFKVCKKCLPVDDPIFFSHYNHIWVSKFRISEFDADFKFKSVEKVSPNFAFLIPMILWMKFFFKVKIVRYIFQLRS